MQDVAEVNLKDLFFCLEKEILECKNISNDFKTEISTKYSIVHDSREPTSGRSIFLCIRGGSYDGHQELGKNECIYVADNRSLVDAYFNQPNCNRNAKIILVKNSRRAWSLLCREAYGRSDEKLSLYGITGTNGKTSTVWFAKQLFDAAGIPCLSIGTLGIYLGQSYQPSSHTTPDPNILHRLFRDAVDKGIRCVVMEVSSHSIAQEKIAGLQFNGTVFTSFSRDHLDYHASMEEYWQTKTKLFTQYTKFDGNSWICETMRQQFCLINDIPQHVHFYKAESFTDAPVIGSFLLENLTAALCFVDSYLSKMGLPKTAPETVKHLKPVPGRFELVQYEDAFLQPTVIVDYAHTPDALEKILKTARSLSQHKLFCIVGCGGDRDKGKRPQMARLAVELADFTYFTSDNPRSENPEGILSDMIHGLTGRENRFNNFSCVVDRKTAIETAILNAGVSDTIVIAGKGHETYQEVLGQRFSFDDREVSRTALAQRKYKVLVLGAGLSGKGAAQLLAQKNCLVTLSNDKDFELPLKLEKQTTLTKHVGQQTESFLENMDLVIVSPGISPTVPIIQSAVKMGLPIRTEIDVAMKWLKSKVVIGITGTNGKSTTTAMTAHLLQKLGIKAVACGNIGLPPSQLLASGEDVDIFVIELSSYQIEGSQEIPCDVVLFTSFSADHLGRHGTINNYFSAKWKLCLGAKDKTGAGIFLAPEVEQASKEFLSNKISTQTVGLTPPFDKVTGYVRTKHDFLNRRMAISAVRYLQNSKKINVVGSDEDWLSKFDDFNPLPYRHITIMERNNHRIINDSKATNVDSVLRALESLDGNCTLLIGGKGKGESFAPILSHADKISEFVCFGEDGAKILEELKNCGTSQTKLMFFPTLKLALKNKKQEFITLSRNVLFAPGCASFDEFSNFEERGRFFDQAILAPVENG